MTTDFSINTLLNLPAKESREVDEEDVKEEPVAISDSGRIFSFVHQSDSNGEYIAGIFISCGCFSGQLQVETISTQVYVRAFHTNNRII